jgi:AraC family transcriptional regulator of adaptative response/methylated-DNA-[protein]-cysteine methyltransferase
MTAVAEHTMDLSPARAWQAVMSRDRRADGRFVFAVRTTGIFCRPSCPARRPLRNNVAFYSDPVPARAAGFRPCRRCHPEAVFSEKQQARELLSRACHLLAQGESVISIGILARQLATTPARLRQLFQSELGLSPASWARTARLVRFKRALRGGRAVTSAQYEAGFSSPSRIYESSDHRLGMTPAVYGKGGKGMEIHYALFTVDSGTALVAWTERGICAAFLGDSANRLIRDLANEFPEASRHPATRGGQEWAATIVKAAMSGIGASDLPLDVAGTAFQWRVWQALRKIPRGETRTYGQVARSIGRPRAVRAVARACATNKAAVLIPCHRVVRETGELAGYRWGIRRKAELLAGEK